MSRILFNIGFTLVLLGFIITFLAIIVLMLKSMTSKPSSIKGGGAILIGPIPIVFGTDKEMLKIVIIILFIVIIIVFILTAFPIFIE